MKKKKLFPFYFLLDLPFEFFICWFNKLDKQNLQFLHPKEMFCNSKGDVSPFDSNKFHVFFHYVIFEVHEDNINLN